MAREEEQEQEATPAWHSEALFNVLDVMSVATAVIEYGAPLNQLQRTGLIQIMDDALITIRRVTQEQVRKEALNGTLMINERREKEHRRPIVAQTDNPHFIVIERVLFESMMSALHHIQATVKDHLATIAEKGSFSGRINESVRYLRHIEESSRRSVILTDDRLAEKVDALIELLRDMDGLLHRYKEHATSIHLSDDGDAFVTEKAL